VLPPASNTIRVKDVESAAAGAARNEHTRAGRGNLIRERRERAAPVTDLPHDPGGCPCPATIESALHRARHGPSQATWVRGVSGSTRSNRGGVSDS
jgi:hypothetical protein